MKKKFTMLFAALLAVAGGAKADVTDVPEMSADGNIKWYTISNTRSTSGKYLYWTADGVKDANTLSGASLFYFTGESGACFIHNAATNLLFSGAGAWTAEGVSCKISETPHSSKAGVAIEFSGTALNESNQGNGFTTWGADDAGSIFVIAPATVSIEETIARLDANKAAGNTIMGEYKYEEESYNKLVAALATLYSTTGTEAATAFESCAEIMAALTYVMPEEGKFYVIECPLFMQVQGVSKGLNSTPAWNTIDLTDKDYYWTVEVKDGTYALKNLGTETYLNGTSMSADVVYATLTRLGEEQFNIVVNGTTMHANGHNNGASASGNIVSWGGSINSASAWCFVEKRDPDLEMAIAALQYRVDELNEMLDNSGINPGEYKSTETAKMVAPLAAAQEVLDGNSESSVTYTDALNTLNNAIASVDLSTIPVTAGLYRIVSANASFEETKGITCYAQDEYFYKNRTNPGWATVNENDPLQYWVLEDAGNGTFSLKAAYEGNYITTATSMTETAKAATFTLLGKAQFNITLAGDDKPFHCQGWNWQNTTQASLTTYQGGIDSPSAWKLIAVSEKPEFTSDLAVGEVGYATLMLAYNATIPTGVTCYTAAVDGKYVKLTEVEGNVLPAKTPVIVAAEAETYTFASTDVTTIVSAENELVGSLYPQIITPDANTTCYVLAKPAAEEGEEENPVGFYQAALNQSSNTAFLNNANKVYLPVATGAEAPAMFSFGRGEGTTSIDNVQLTIDNVVIYDLAGRRVAKMEKGIYIVNGKKVIK